MGPRSLYRSLSLFLSALSLSSLGVASGSAVPEVGATLWGVLWAVAALITLRARVRFRSRDPATCAFFRPDMSSVSK